MMNDHQSIEPADHPAQQKSQAVLAEVLEQHQEALVGFIKRNLGMTLKQKVEAHDILQDTMISAIKSFDSTNFDQLNTYAWLCHLSEQRIIDAHRRHFGSQKRAADREIGLETPFSASRPGGMIDILVTSMTTPTQAVQRDENIDAMNAVFNGSSEEQKQALYLRYVDGLPLHEISERLGKSNGAIRVMLSRAVARVQSGIRGDETLT